MLALWNIIRQTEKNSSDSKLLPNYEKSVKVLPMLKIRLQMTGRRNDRHFRIIVAEHTVGPKSGKYIEKLGFINPRTKEKQIDVERAKYWISVGAQPTGRVYNMLVDQGAIEGPKKNVLPKKTPIVSDEPQEEKEEVATEEVAEESADTPDEGSEDVESDTQEEVSEEKTD